MKNETVLWGVKIGSPDYMEEIISTNPACFEKATEWAKANGYDRLRTAVVNLSQKPDFGATINM